VRHRPPVQLVDAICVKVRDLQHVPIPEDAVDGSGRTPLHIAAAAGCGTDVILRLLQGRTGFGPAVGTDRRGRTALHWAAVAAAAASSASGTSNNNSNRTKLKATAWAENEDTTAAAILVNNLRILATSHPHAKVIHDDNDQTPLQLFLDAAGAGGGAVADSNNHTQMLAWLRPTPKQLTEQVINNKTTTMTNKNINNTISSRTAGYSVVECSHDENDDTVLSDNNEEVPLLHVSVLVRDAADHDGDEQDPTDGDTTVSSIGNVSRHKEDKLIVGDPVPTSPDNQYEMVEV
jgi:ankyrin repeat protein